MPCTKCKEGKYKWGKTGECEYATKEACESANHKYSKMRPTPLGKKSYDEYAKELKEFNLSKVERVELGLTDDAKKLVKDGNALKKKMDSTYKPFPKLESDFGKIYERIQEFIKEADGLPKEAKAIQKESLNLYRKLEKSADDLGVDVTDIPIAKQLDEIGVDLEDNITQIENALRDAKAV